MFCGLLHTDLNAVVQVAQKDGRIFVYVYKKTEMRKKYLPKCERTVIM